MNSLKSKKLHFIVLAIISLLLLLIPLSWGKLYHLGGDDSRAYYLFPWEFIKNWAVNIISDNGTGTWSSYSYPSYFIPIIFLIFIVKTIFSSIFNIQYLMFGLNLVFGFTFFYLLLGLWIKSDDFYSFLAKVLASLFYVFSPYLYSSLYLSQLLGLYLISIVPATLFFFIKGLYEDKNLYIVISAVIIGLFNYSAIAAPFTLGVLFCISPLLLYLFFKNKRQFLKKTLIFLLIFILLNLHWLLILIHTFISSAKGADVISAINSISLRKNNDPIITSVYKLNNLNSLFFYNFGYNKLGQSFFTLIKILFILIIVTAGVINKNAKKIYRELYAINVGGLLVAFFLLSPNIGEWSVRVFLWLTSAIPGFVMFRNMYDKFGLALAMTYALILGVSLKIVVDSIKNINIKRFIFIILFIILFINTLPLITAERYKYPIYTTTHSFDSTYDFNPDFYGLVNYLKKVPDPSHYLWYPLNKFSFLVIGDSKLSNHFYMGISPLQYMAAKQDYTSIMNLGSPYERDIGKKVIKYIHAKDYNKIAEYLQKLNIRYIILNNDVFNSVDIQNSFIYDEGFFYMQNNKELMSFLFGKKIKEFGKRYAIYQINDNYISNKLYLTDNFNIIPNLNQSNFQFEKKASFEYRISIKNLKVETKLVFLDPFYKGWTLYFKNRKNVVTKNLFVLNYANGWIINPKEILNKFPKSLYHLNSDGSINIDLILYFKPQDYFYFASSISLLTLITCLLYLFINLRNQLNHPSNKHQ